MAPEGKDPLPDAGHHRDGPGRLPVYILAGGHSYRMGRDKARLELDGLPLLVHAARLASILASRITVVGSRPDVYGDLGLPTVADLVPERGPLGGLVTALAHLAETGQEPQGWLLLLSCDMWGLQPAWLRLLVDHRQQGARAVVFRGELWQPMPGLYHRELLGLAREHLEQGRLALWRLLERARATALALPPGWEQVVRLDRPEDMGRLPAG